MDNDNVVEKIMGDANRAERLIALEEQADRLVTELAVMNAKLMQDGIITNALFDAAVSIKATGTVLSELADGLLLGAATQTDQTDSTISQNIQGEPAKGGPTTGPAFF